MKSCLSILITLGALVQGTFAGQQTRKLLIEAQTTGAYASGGNAATSLPGATSLATGAATTFTSFSTALDACTSTSCDIYFNFHTNYSFGYNAGAFGVARAQLVRDPFCDASLVKCFSAVATSVKTNIVHGLPNQLPHDAGSAIAKVFWRYPFGQTDFVLYAELSVDNAIKYNSNIIGAHLHTGAADINGPVNIVFCGSSPLPAPIVLNGACKAF